MFSAIDHLVIVTSELKAAIQDYTAAGFTVIRGGRHDVGTHNALVALADGSYLELIEFLQPVAGNFSRSADTALACWYGALRTGGGIVDFCMRTDDLAADDFDNAVWPRFDLQIWPHLDMFFDHSSFRALSNAPFRVSYFLPPPAGRLAAERC